MNKFVSCLIVLSFFACNRENPNKSTREIVMFQSLNNADIILTDSTIIRRKVYVPIYSDIYQIDKSESTTQLTATLSIRNTSEWDSIFIGRVDYFNTRGDLVTQYLNDTIYLNPLETIDYVIAEKDTLGGSGANFLVEWYGQDHHDPVIQAVMIGGLGNKLFSFTTEGRIVKEGNSSN